MAEISADVHAGLAGFQLTVDSYDLGEGITISKTYAHLMAHFVMAFALPEQPNKPHPGPWKPLPSGFTFDITADLHVPSHHLDGMEIARTIVFLLRFWINPATRLAAYSNHPFASIKDAADTQVALAAIEILPRQFPLMTTNFLGSDEALGWIRQHWRLTHKLIDDSPEFALAVAAIDAGQFIENTALTLLSLWAALEALFSPSTTELKFRISALIATFLEPLGESRLKVQKHVAALYDKRSAAAHGKPKHDRGDLLDSFNLLRRVVLKIIEDGKVSTKEELEAKLFGAN